MIIRLEHIRKSFKSAYRKVIIFFNRYRGRNVLIFLFFLFMSFCFWILLSLQEEYEIQVEMPIHYKNTSPDIAFTKTLPTEITARVRDKGTILLNYSVGKNMPALEIDMKEVSGKKGTFVYPAKEIESALMKRFSSTTSLLNFTPQQIEETYSKLMNRKLQVVFNGDIRTRPGFLVSGDITINPSIVDVYASDIILDTLKSVSTVYMGIRDGKKTIEEKIKILTPEGAVVEPENVSVTIPIEEYTVKTLEIPVGSKGVPPGFTIRMFPAKVNINCNVPLSRFKNLSEDEFSVEVSIDDQYVSGLLPVIITKKPAWVNEVSLSPNTIEFIIEQNNSDD